MTEARDLALLVLDMDRRLVSPDAIFATVEARLHALLAAQRERDAQTISALHCPECRAGDIPVYDEYWRAYYHGTLLCFGSPDRCALRS